MRRQRRRLGITWNRKQNAVYLLRRRFIGAIPSSERYSSEFFCPF
nr:MAG TPA: hypothetical protein [Caudoviricetes sp.]